MIPESFRRGVPALSRTEESIADIALGLSFIVAFVGVICRYVLEISVWWIFPVQHYSYIILVMFGAVIASRKQIHVRVEVLDSVLEKKPKAKLILRVSLQFIAFACSCLFTYLSYHFMIWAWASGQCDVVLTWFNLGVVKSLLFVLGLFFCTYFGAYFIRNAVKLVKMGTHGRGQA